MKFFLFLLPLSATLFCTLNLKAQNPLIVTTTLPTSSPEFVTTTTQKSGALMNPSIAPIDKQEQLSIKANDPVSPLGPKLKPQKLKLSLAVIESVSKSEFEQIYEPLWKSYLKNCSCTYQNLSPYKEDGSFDSRRIEASLEMALSSQILYLGWNDLNGAQHESLKKQIAVLLEKGVLVVGRTGSAAADQPVYALARTVLAQIADLVIVGDMMERERLHPRSYFGPEMLTAIQAPKSEERKDIGALLFVSKLAEEFHKKDSSQWLAHFKSVKVKTRKLWPSLNDLF